MASKPKREYSKVVIVSLIGVFWLLIILMWAFQTNLITGASSTLLASVIAIISTIIAAYLTYRQAQEDKSVWLKTDEIWKDLEACTALIVGDFKEMQQILKSYLLLRDLDPKKTAAERGIAIYSIGNWLVTSYPDFFKEDDKSLNALALQIRNPMGTSQKEPRIGDEDVRRTLLCVLNAEFLTLHKSINDSRSKLCVISVYGGMMNNHIMATLEFMVRTRDSNDRKVQPDIYEKAHPCIDEYIKRIQEICRFELEMTRLGRRDAIGEQFQDPNELPALSPLP